jgi:hypothetical protein
MRKKVLTVMGLTMALVVLTGFVVRYGSRSAQAIGSEANPDVAEAYPEANPEMAAAENGFSVEVPVDGRPLAEYAARGRRYIEALENAEYEVRVHNPTGSRVAVALAVDGLNSIDARHTSAWDAHKWVIEPYGTIHVRGWQMSGESARRFYFTTERDSYAAKLGQAQNLGLITAVFFRERRPVTITATPSERRPPYKEDRARDERSAPEPGTAGESSAQNQGGRDAAKTRSMPSYPPPDDESAATGIGRSVRNDVQWIKMDLDPRPAGEISIRYEYRASLVRLGIIPRDYPRPNVLDRRERAQGFEPKYCPQP